MSARRVTEVFLIYLKLGCTSFGGPVAHLGYFQKELVEKRGWISLEAFTELVALSQSLPGPASSQVGYGIGLIRAGVPGGVAAWLGFTLPSALLMLAVAAGSIAFTSRTAVGFLHGLQLAAVAVVAQAVLTMQRSQAPDRPRFLIAFAAVLLLLTPIPDATLFAILLGAAAGLALKENNTDPGMEELLPPVSFRTAGIVAAVAFCLLLAASLVLAIGSLNSVSLFATFYRTGALVFGGGHVVLPLLESSTVCRGWIPQETFLAGYGAAQALPGPLFAYSAFLGAAVHPNAHPFLNGIVALVGIFLPGLLLITAILPFWSVVRNGKRVRRALRGINAAVVGILVAALYHPIWTSSVRSASDFALALGAFTALVQWKAPPWAVVLTAGLTGVAINR
jgi:chromate transporter